MSLRDLTKDEKARLIDVIKQAFAYEVSMEELQEIIELYKEVEGRIIGRIAGDIHDILLNFFVRKYANQILPGPMHTQGEIGVLFGGSTILGFKAIQNEQQRNHILVIDPLDGFYLSDPNAASIRDSVSNCEVTLDNLLKNFDACNVDHQAIEILQDYSTSHSCIENVKNRSFSFLFIDGDHTESGIRNDWDHFASKVVDRGIVVIDNVNDWPWRDVNLFIYKLLNQENFSMNWGVRAYYRRTIILQRGAPHNSVVYEALKSSMKYSYNAIWNYNNLSKNQIMSKAKECNPFKSFLRFISKSRLGL